MKRRVDVGLMQENRLARTMCLVNRRMKVQMLQPDRRPSLEPLISGVNLDPSRFQRRDTQERFGMVLTEVHGRPDDLTHELDLCHGNVDSDLRAISQLVGPSPLRFDPDLAESIPWNVAIDCSGIDQKQAFPSLFGVSRVHDGSRDMDGTHGCVQKKTPTLVAG